MLDQDSLSGIYARYGILKKYGVPFSQFVTDFGQLHIPDDQRRNPDIGMLVRQLEAKYISAAGQRASK